MMRGLTLAVGLLLAGWTAQAAEIEVRLVRASNQSEAPDEKLKDLEPKLRKVFGFRRYEQIGLKQEKLSEEGRVSIYPGEGFTVFVQSMSLAPDRHQLEVELFSGKASVLKTTARFPENSTVFIRGPEIGSGLIIVVLTVLK
jgi:hypothetical protein